MMPLSLTMSAFGPYKDVVTIDFTLFKDKLFLINGPTGSGKTTIFDAISYALYGNPTGEYRDSSFLRSSYADIDRKTYVEFVFGYHGKTYKVTRYPSQERRALRKAKNGSELTLDAESVTLEGADFKPLSKTKEVNAKIIEILGLDKNQFEETMMIAQGDFNKLINADTKSRSAIFRKILKTEDLASFKEKLKDEDREANDSLKGKNIALLGLLHGYQTEDPSLKGRIMDKDAGNDLEGLFSLVEEDEKTAELLLPSLKKASDEKEKAKTELIKKKEAAVAFNKRKEAYLQAKGDFDALMSKKEDIDQKKDSRSKATRAQNVLGAYALYERSLSDKKLAVSNKERLEKLLPVRQEEYQKAEDGRKTAIPLLEQQEQSLSGELSELARKRTLFAQLGDAIKKHEECVLLEKSAHLAFEKAKQKKSEAERLIADIHNRYLTYQESDNVGLLKKDLSDFYGRKDKLNHLKEKYEEYLELSKKSSSSERDYLVARASHDEAVSHYQEVFNAFVDGQAGILAEKLAEGVPCPVCGSLEHPHPAIRHAGVSNEGEVKAAKSRMEALGRESEEKAKASQASKSTLDSSLAHLKEEYSSLTDKGFSLSSFERDCASFWEENEESIKKTAQAQAMAESKKKRHDEDLLRAQKAQEEIDASLSQEENEAQARLSSSEKNEASAKESVDGLKKDIAGVSLTDVEKTIQEKTARQRAISQERTALEKASKDAQSELSSLSAELASVTSEIKALDGQLSKEEENVRASLKENGFLRVEEAQSASLSVAQMGQLQAEIQVFDNNYASLSAILEEGKKNHCDSLGEQDVGALEAALVTAASEANGALTRYSALHERHEANREIVLEARKTLDSAKRDLLKAKDIHQLYLTATGQLNGVSHIDFEVYYQARIFDEILASASKKLNDMTDGRYVFARRKAPLSGVGLFGLDIDVIDYNSGKERPVSTLSGGESFMASLSLALSLSEIIQQKAGGIELDSMFVDEGFGSLDPESLENAIRILNNLSNNGHRLVGIISHVEALENSIPLQIVVSKGKDGSKIRIVS